jgi:hypothetical protein
VAVGVFDIDRDGVCDRVALEVSISIVTDSVIAIDSAIGAGWSSTSKLAFA